MAEVKASFDLTTLEGKKRLFNAKSGSSISMKTLDNGTELEVVGVIQYPEIIDTYGNGQEGTVTVLYTADGHSYAAVSETVARAASALIDFFNETGVDSVIVRVVKAKSSKNNEFLNLELL